MPRVYLETSFISACVTTRTSLRSRYERGTSLNWWENEASGHELYVSDEVLNELSSPRFPNRDTALGFIRDVPALPITEAMVEFAAVLVERMVMPRPVAGDALHVSIATIADMDFLVTWNVRHLANPNKLLHLNGVCLEFGHICPRILRPDDMLELER